VYNEDNETSEPRAAAEVESDGEWNQDDTDIRGHRRDFNCDIKTEDNVDESLRFDEDPLLVEDAFDIAVEPPHK
jgi:hypothetical protein